MLGHYRKLAGIGHARDTVVIPITPREMELLFCVTCGDGTSEINSIFGISDQTVTNHMTSSLRTPQLFDRPRAVVETLPLG